MIRFVLARLRRYGSFYKFVALHLVAVLLVVEIASHLTAVSLQGSSLPLAQLFAYPEVWQTVVALARWLYYIPAFFTVQLVCAELELRLVRAHVINGLGRSQIALAWGVQSLLLSLVGVVATVIAVLVFGDRSAPGSVPGLTGGLLPEAGLLLYGWAFLSWAVLCAVLLRRPVPALVLLILGPLVVEPMLGMMLRHYELDTLAGGLPFASLSALVPWPGGESGLSLAAPAVFLSAAWGGAAAGLSWWRLVSFDL